MERYYIHIEGGPGSLHDEVGGEFASPELAIGEAAKTTGELIRDELRDGLADCGLTVRVEREGGTTVGTITMTVSVAVPT